MAASFETTERLLSFDQTPLFWRKQVPEKPKAHLIVVHGFSEHGGRYAHLANYLAGKGYGVWAMDNRGHGRSAGKRGHIDHYDDYLGDLLTFFALVREKSGGEKPFLFGHSNGGLIALRFVLAHADKLSGLILSDPLLELAMKIPPTKKLAGRLLARLSPSFSIKNELAPEQLTHDPAMIEAYLADPLIFHVATVGWFTEMERAAADARQRGGELRVPLLLLLGGADPVCSVAASRTFYGSVTGAEKELKVYEGFYHEIVNETGRERVFTDLAAWLDKHA